LIYFSACWFTLIHVFAACAADPCHSSAAYLQDGTEFESLSDASMSPGDLLHVCAGVHTLALWSPFTTPEGSREIVGDGSQSTFIEFAAGYALGTGVDSLSVSGLTFRKSGGVPSNSCPGSDVPCYDLWWCGAVNVFDGYSYVFTDVTFQSNGADYGGAICVNGNDDDPARVRAPDVRLVDSKFVSNVAARAGGALLIDGPATVTSDNTD
jgi:predicted outer membrane repeat protein